MGFVRRYGYAWGLVLALGCGGSDDGEPAPLGDDDGGDDGTAGTSGRDTGDPGAPDGTGDDASDDTSTADPPDVVDPWTLVVDEPFEVAIGGTVTVYEPPSTFDFGSFPDALAVPRRDGVPGVRALVSFSENADTADATLSTRTMGTTDFGASWETLDEVGLTNAGVLADGSILAVAFVPSWTLGDTTAMVPIRRSTDGGVSWSSDTAVFDADATLLGLRFHRGLQQLTHGPDAGTILVPFYAMFSGDSSRTIGLAASTDGGATWTRWGTIAPPNDPTRTWDETSFVVTRSGEIVAVTRAYVDGDLGPLLVCRSTDDGHTFTDPEPIQVAFGDGAPAPRVGVDPGLMRLPSGVLLLVGGRPDNFVAFSGDDGHTWTQASVTYVNHSSQLATHGSSGYQGIAALTSHRALLTGDNCANSWGCPASDSGWTVDGEYRIWRRLVDVMPPDPGRLDLATAVARGDAGIETDLVAEDPGLGVLAPFDGSIAPGSGLRGAGTITIDLGGPHTLTRLALASTIGEGTASVRLFDGAQWIDPQIVTSPGGDRVLRAFVPAAPQVVEIVEITTTADGGLAELELQTNTNSFEDEALGRRPRAALDANLAPVVRTTGDDATSSQAVHLHDTSDAAIASITFPLPSGWRAILATRAVELPGAMLFGLTDPAGPRVHLSLDADGRVQQYDPATTTWSEIAPAGTVDPFATFDLSLGADEVRLGEVALPIRWPAAFAPTEVYVTSTGTAPVGVDVWLDDLRYE